MIESLYKVGDVVRVLSHRDPASSHFLNYPTGLTDRMIERFGGKLVTISEVEPLNEVYTHAKYYNGDRYAYKLEEDSEKLLWHSSMFESEVVAHSVESDDSSISWSIKLSTPTIKLSFL